jgi:RNA polymerase sigma factor (sigma-70 family)
MLKTRSYGIVGYLRRAALLSAGEDHSDGQLLDCFINTRDESAFEMLVRRHGPMVFGVCKRLIGNHQDAEDAFQAVFLVLARKAASVMPRAAVGNWLYGVAYRTAWRARAVATRRSAREQQLVTMQGLARESENAIEDLEPILDEELNRLPDKYRLPLVLCDLESRSRKSVAQQLKLPEGTLSSRLARGRRMLAKRLTGRGVTVSGGALGMKLSGSAALAGVPLVVSTVKAAVTVAAGGAASSVVSANVAALTEGVVKAMFMTKVCTASIVPGIVVALGLAVGSLTQSIPAAEKEVARKDSQALSLAVKAENRVGALKPTEEEARMKLLREEMERARVVVVSDIEKALKPLKTSFGHDKEAKAKVLDEVEKAVKEMIKEMRQQIVGDEADEEKQSNKEQSPFDIKMLRQLNADEPLTLLNCKKPITLAIKVFRGVDQAPEKAHNLAELLRKVKIEAYALHTKFNSVVTVGGFDSLEDPTLIATRKYLEEHLPTVERQAPERDRPILFFTKPMPMKVPR